MSIVTVVSVCVWTAWKRHEPYTTILKLSLRKKRSEMEA